MKDPMGVSSGKVSELGINNLSNEFATIPDQSLETAADRVQPRQVASGTTRGTQTVMNTDGSYMTYGLIPDSDDFGIAFFTAQGKLISKSTSTTDFKYDNSGNLISKDDGNTLYVYDPTTGKNILQIGKLPDGTYGQVVAKAGFDVSEIFT